VLVSIGNSGELSLAPAAEQRLADPSPLVRGAAVWALQRLDRMRLSTHASVRAAERDAAVLQEWIATDAEAET
jgi:epoxyqueuosine reductase